MLGTAVSVPSSTSTPSGAFAGEDSTFLSSKPPRDLLLSLSLVIVRVRSARVFAKDNK